MSRQPLDSLFIGQYLTRFILFMGPGSGWGWKMDFIIFLQTICMDSPDIYLNPLPQNYPLQEMANFFQLTLKEHNHPIGDQQVMSEPVNPTKNSTILMDVQRTRSSFMPKHLKPEMEKILVHFCRLQKLEYKQGMNQILAPFIYFREIGFSISKCYSLFRAFFDQYCLNFYYDKDFNSLEVIFKMITVMIKYHDPALARYLQNYEIQPQIYCISWLMTMFSSKLSLKLTYTLWQLMAVERDDYFIFFLIIAIIINRREAIIQTKVCSIFTIITNLIFKDESELLNTVKIALLLRKTTPNSLILFFREHAIFKQRSSFNRINTLLTKIDKLDLFLVGPLQVSLKQHFKLGICEKRCYFCSLRQPLKLHYQQQQLSQHFPTFSRELALSNDVRTMDYSLDFIVIDVRKSKSQKLVRIEGLTIYAIDTSDLIQNIEAKFNDEFMEARGRQHFLFLLNDFSFEKADSFESEEFYFCHKLIKILNSYSYCYLSILEGGEAAYSTFVKQLRLKSELLNSKIQPVSEYTEGDPQDEQPPSRFSFVGKENPLQIKEMVTFQQLYQANKLCIFEGEENSEDQILFLTEGFVIWIQRNGLLERLLKFIRQRKSIITHLLEQPYVIDIPFKIIAMHSLFRVKKLTVRVHHNNCLLFYIQEFHQDGQRAYLKSSRNLLWTYPLHEQMDEDLKIKGQSKILRLGFDSTSFNMVKEIGIKIKGFYRKSLKMKNQLQEEVQRLDELNKNIIEEYDFSRKDTYQGISNAKT